MKPFETPDEIITANTMKNAEQSAVNVGVSVRDLMENAGRAVAEEVMRHYAVRPTLVFCGPGNNGGDGFVAARHLLEAGWPVRVMSVVSSLDVYQGAALEAAKAFPGEIEPLSPYGLEDVELVVDALFGTGLERPISGELKAVIDIINDLDAPAIAVDIPSGIHGDSGEIMGCGVKAELTITFGRARPGHFLVPGCLYSGKVIVADIGIPEKFFSGDRLSCNRPKNWLHHLRTPSAYDNKFTRGCCMVFGSHQMTGAVKLSATAARRAGVGLVIIGCAPEAYGLYAGNVLGEIVYPLGSYTQLGELVKARKISSLLLGPGAPVSDETQKIVLEVLKQKIPLVLDGGALSSFENNTEELLKNLHDQVILTPHEGEFKRLFPDVKANGLGKISRAREAAQRAACTVVFKGHDTVIAAADGECVVNTNAPSTLATAGAGDVLAGIIGGLTANHHTPFISAQVGVWMHGEAAQSLGEGLIAEDLIQEIPRVWKLLRTKSPVAF